MNSRHMNSKTLVTFKKSVNNQSEYLRQPGKENSTMFASLRSLNIRPLQITSLVLLTLISTSVALGQAQSSTANIQGFVRDTSGAVVPNATVTARFPGTNVSRTTTTNDEGRYRLINLPPGDYDITVEAPNFKKAVLS